MSTERKIADPLLEDALDRLLRQQGGDEAGLDAWLAQSDKHRRAWTLAKRSWDVLGELPRAAPVLDLGPRRARQRRTRRWIGGLAVAASVAFLLLIYTPSILIGFTASHQTSVGKIETLVLADGTQVTLSGDSAIAEAFDETRRGVRLLKGEAFFDVSHDAMRPFVVNVGGVDVTVLGTAFDVRLSGESTTVELARGSVAVSRAGAPFEQLAPGESVRVDATGVRRGTVAPADVGMWRNGRLFVDGASVAEVVARVQRYHPSWIIVPDAELADRMVTGLYDLSDPDRALRALVQPFGGQVLEVSPLLRIVTRR